MLKYNPQNEMAVNPVSELATPHALTVTPVSYTHLVIVTLGGFIWGPMTSCIVSVIVATLEMITVSDTGILGCIMNLSLIHI